MNVGELIAKLSEFDPDLPVIIDDTLSPLDAKRAELVDGEWVIIYGTES